MDRSDGGSSLPLNSESKELKRQEIARSRLLVKVRREEARLTRKRERLAAQFEMAKKFDESFHEGELLKSNYPLLKRGMKEVRLPDWKEGESERLITLRPDKRPVELVAAKFKEARKRERAIPHLEEQLRKVDGEMAELQMRRAAIESAGTVEELEALSVAKAAMPRMRGEIRAAPLPKEPFRRFYSASGLELLVGRSAAENDQLTFQIARGHDLWLHAHGASGAHVVVRLGVGEEPDSEALKDAIELALRYSGAKKAQGGEVSITRRKWVSKPRGAKAGLVTLSQYKLGFGTLDSKRWEALSKRGPPPSASTS